jgi:uncharacterized protein YoxC
MTEKKAPAAKKTSTKKVTTKKAVTSTKRENVTVEDMHELLSILRGALDSRDKVVDHLQTQISLNQQQIEQNKKILAKRGLIYKLAFILLAIGVLVVGFDQHTIVKSFDKDMTNVSKDMDKMLVEMTAMRKAMEAMSTDMHSMSGDFSAVAKNVSSIDKSVVTMSQDVKSMSYGVRGMSYDTHEMNRNMDNMVPPFSPW